MAPRELDIFMHTINLILPLFNSGIITENFIQNKQNLSKIMSIFINTVYNVNLILAPLQFNQIASTQIRFQFFFIELSAHITLLFATCLWFTLLSFKVNLILWNALEPSYISHADKTRKYITKGMQLPSIEIKSCCLFGEVV